MAPLEAYGGEGLGDRPRLELLGALRMRSADSKCRFPRPQRRLPSSSKRRPCPIPHVHSVTSRGLSGRLTSLNTCSVGTSQRSRAATKMVKDDTVTCANAAKAMSASGRSAPPNQLSVSQFTNSSFGSLSDGPVGRPVSLSESVPAGPRVSVSHENHYGDCVTRSPTPKGDMLKE